MTSQWTDRYADRVLHLHSSVIREILKITQQPDIISFAGGLPAPELFPTSRILEATRRVLEEHGGQALQYSPTEGYVPLREMIVRHMARYGIVVDVDNVMITSSLQQAVTIM